DGSVVRLHHLERDHGYQRGGVEPRAPRVEARRKEPDQRDGDYPGRRREHAADERNLLDARIRIADEAERMPGSGHETDQVEVERRIEETLRHERRARERNEPPAGLSPEELLVEEAAVVEPPAESPEAQCDRDRGDRHDASPEDPTGAGGARHRAQLYHPGENVHAFASDETISGGARSRTPGEKCSQSSPPGSASTSRRRPRSASFPHLPPPVRRRERPRRSSCSTRYSPTSHTGS